MFSALVFLASALLVSGSGLGVIYSPSYTLGLNHGYYGLNQGYYGLSYGLPIGGQPLVPGLAKHDAEIAALKAVEATPAEVRPTPGKVHAPVVHHEEHHAAPVVPGLDQHAAGLAKHDAEVAAVKAVEATHPALRPVPGGILAGLYGLGYGAYGLGYGYPWTGYTGYTHTYAPVIAAPAAHLTLQVDPVHQEVKTAHHEVGHGLSHGQALQVHAGQVAHQKAIVAEQTAAYGLDLPEKLGVGPAPEVKVAHHGPAVVAGHVAIGHHGPIVTGLTHGQALQVHAQQEHNLKGLVAQTTAAHGLDLPLRLPKILAPTVQIKTVKW